MVASGQFREDLLYRLKVIHMHVPPLRDGARTSALLVLRLVARTAATA